MGFIQKKYLETFHNNRLGRIWKMEFCKAHEKYWLRNTDFFIIIIQANEGRWPALMMTSKVDYVIWRKKLSDSQKSLRRKLLWLSRPIQRTRRWKIFNSTNLIIALRVSSPRDDIKVLQLLIILYFAFFQAQVSNVTCVTAMNMDDYAPTLKPTKMASL